MEELSKEKLENLKGGGISIWGAITIVTGVVFLIGVIDGFVRPLPCNE